jgi:hypothetical protein
MVKLMETETMKESRIFEVAYSVKGWTRSNEEERGVRFCLLRSWLPGRLPT